MRVAALEQDDAQANWERERRPDQYCAREQPPRSLRVGDRLLSTDSSARCWVERESGNRPGTVSAARFGRDQRDGRGPRNRGRARVMSRSVGRRPAALHGTDCELLGGKLGSHAIERGANCIRELLHHWEALPGFLGKCSPDEAVNVAWDSGDDRFEAWWQLRNLHRHDDLR